MDGASINITDVELKPGQIWKIFEMGILSFEIVRLSKDKKQVSIRIHSAHGAIVPPITPVSSMNEKEFRSTFLFLQKDEK